METTVLEKGERMCRELPCSHGLGHGTNPNLCWCKEPRMDNQRSRRNSYSHRNTDAIMITHNITKSCGAKNSQIK
jgi:hypothetical protein